VGIQYIVILHGVQVKQAKIFHLLETPSLSRKKQKHVLTLARSLSFRDFYILVQMYFNCNSSKKYIYTDV